MALASAAIKSIEGGPGSLDTKKVEDPHVFLIEYCDGLEAAVLMLGDNGYVQKFAYAARRGATIDALEYHTDTGPAHASFSYLGLNIEDFFLSGTPPTPVERTYLTTGILEAAMISRGQNGERVETPHLAISYTPSQRPCRRPTGLRPTGACLDPQASLEPGATPAAEAIPIARDGTIRGRRK